MLTATEAPPETTSDAKLIAFSNQTSTENSIHLSDTPNTRKVLVVDEEGSNRDKLIQLLNAHSYHPLEASNGQDAIETVRNEKIDLVMLGLSSPDTSGFETLREIRRRANQTELPVIMVTGDQSSDHLVQALEEGANDFVTKPVDVGATIARIKTHLKLKLAQEKLRESEERYSLAARGANDGLWDWDLKTNAVYYSPRWNAMLRLGDRELLNTPGAWLDRIHPEDRVRVSVDMESHLSGVSEHFESEMRLRTKDGSYRWMLCRGLAVRERSGEARRFAGSLTDITESKVADPLTGLPNRVLFNERLQRCADRINRSPESRFAVLYLDVDNFNVINDGLGHDVGDQMLISVARRLESSVRLCESTIARLGGDEFAILIEQLTTNITIDAVARRIIESLKAPFAVGCGREVFTSVSVGVSVSSKRISSPTELIREADTAMFQAKKSGKSCYRVFDPGMKERVSARLSLESMLRRAIDREEFLLNYQPIVDLGSGCLVGTEALIRWKHSEMGMVPPSDFIPIAEETGMIVPIGSWVLRKACKQLVDWQKQNPDMPNLFMSINVSPHQFSTDLVTEVRGVISSTGIAPQSLKIEVTESAIMKNTEEAAGILNELRNEGVTVAIDDFGTGYSSLAYLHRLPLDCLKVDQSFVNKMTSTKDNRMIVETITKLAKTLGLDIIAEGIETPEQRDLLRTIGCNKGQGFYFSKPLKVDQLAKLLKRTTHLPSA